MSLVVTFFSLSHVWFHQQHDHTFSRTLMWWMCLVFSQLWGAIQQIFGLHNCSQPKCYAKVVRLVCQILLEAAPCFCNVCSRPATDMPQIQTIHQILGQTCWRRVAPAILFAKVEIAHYLPEVVPGHSLSEGQPRVLRPKALYRYFFFSLYAPQGNEGPQLSHRVSRSMCCSICLPTKHKNAVNRPSVLCFAFGCGICGLRNNILGLMSPSQFF